MKHEHADIVIHLISLTFPLILQQFLVAFVQCPLDSLVILLHDPLDRQHILFYQHSAVHLAAAVHQIVGLVHQKNVVTACPLLEKAFEIHIGIKHIIVIAQNIVHPGGHVQTEFKGAHRIRLCLSQNLLPCEHIRGLQQIIDCIIHPVIMPFGIGAVHGITVHLVTHAQLFLCRQLNGFRHIPMLPQKAEGLLRHRSCNRLGREVENAVALPLPHSFHRRKNRGDRLSHTGGRLQKQGLLPDDRAVDIADQRLLPLPIGIRKHKLCDAGLTLFLPLYLKIRPFPILDNKLRKPLIQGFPCVFFPEIPDFFIVQIAVGHLHADVFQPVLQRINIGIAHGLRLMDIDRILHGPHIAVNSLDLIDIIHIAGLLRRADGCKMFFRFLKPQCELIIPILLRPDFRKHLLCHVEDPICPAFHFQNVILRLDAYL